MTDTNIISNPSFITAFAKLAANEKSDKWTSAITLQETFPALNRETFLAMVETIKGDISKARVVDMELQAETLVKPALWKAVNRLVTLKETKGQKKNLTKGNDDKANEDWLVYDVVFKDMRAKLLASVVKSKRDDDAKFATTIFDNAFKDVKQMTRGAAIKKKVDDFLKRASDISTYLELLTPEEIDEHKLADDILLIASLSE